MRKWSGIETLCEKKKRIIQEIGVWNKRKPSHEKETEKEKEKKPSKYIGQRRDERVVSGGY